MSAHEVALEKAKIQLMASEDSAFFTTVCFSMKHIWDERIPTACTNGLEIRYSPAFFMGLDPDEQLFLLLHETLHVALLHMTRLNGRDPRRWNIAADYVINYILVQRGFKMPKGGLYDEQYAGMNTDEVYDLLANQPTEDLPMEDIQAPEDPDELDQTQGQIDDILVRATLQSQMANDDAGSIPGEIQVYVNGLLNPKLPWHRILQRYMTKAIKTDYTFRRPNRRFFPKHYLPSMYTESLVDIAEAIDASSSVTEKEYHRFVSESYGLLSKHKPDTLTLIQFTSHIRSVDQVASAEDLKNMHFHRYGGTNIEPVMDWAMENKPNLLLVFTDGEFENNAPDPGVPVIWIINGNASFTAPYGKVIHFDPD